MTSSTTTEENLSSISKRHLMELQVMHKNLTVIALETQMLEQQAALNQKEASKDEEVLAAPNQNGASKDEEVSAPDCSEQRPTVARSRTAELADAKEQIEFVKTQQAVAVEIFDEELLEMQGRLQKLQEQLDQEKAEREALMTQLASISERRAVDLDQKELQGLKDSYGSVQHALDQIVDACVKQKMAMKTARSVGNLWLNLVRTKRTSGLEHGAQKAAPPTSSLLREALYAQPILAPSKTEELAKRTQELKVAKHEAVKAKMQKEAAIEVFDDETMGLQRRICELEEQLVQEERDNQAQCVMLQNSINTLKDQFPHLHTLVVSLKEQLQEERAARGKLQTQLHLRPEQKKMHKVSMQSVAVPAVFITGSSRPNTPRQQTSSTSTPRDSVASTPRMPVNPCAHSSASTPRAYPDTRARALVSYVAASQNPKVDHAMSVPSLSLVPPRQLHGTPIKLRAFESYCSLVQGPDQKRSSSVGALVPSPRGYVCQDACGASVY